MEFKLPKNEKYRWTMHVCRKMRFYGLTPSRVLRIVNAPERIEEGVALGTLAGMHTIGTKKKPHEIWAMWRDEKPVSSNQLSVDSSELKTVNYKLKTHFSARKVIITAWRYPGTSPVRGAVPIPPGVLAELEAEGEV